MKLYDRLFPPNAAAKAKRHRQLRKNARDLLTKVEITTAYKYINTFFPDGEQREEFIQAIVEEYHAMSGGG